MLRLKVTPHVDRHPVSINVPGNRPARAPLGPDVGITMHVCNALWKNGFQNRDTRCRSREDHRNGSTTIIPALLLTSSTSYTVLYYYASVTYNNNNFKQ